MRPTGTKQQLEMRRRVAMALLDVGWGVRQVARQVQASPGSVCRWRDTRAQQGEAGRSAKRHPGSQPKLSAMQRQQWLALLSQGARAHVTIPYAPQFATAAVTSVRTFVTVASPPPHGHWHTTP